jgi:hypothetical protein
MNLGAHFIVRVEVAHPLVPGYLLTQAE